MDSGGEVEGGNFIPPNLNLRTAENRSGGIASYDSERQLQRHLRWDPVITIGLQLGLDERLKRGTRIGHLSSL